MDEYIEKTVDLVYKNNGKDRNGRTLELDEFKKVIGSERVQELMRTNMLCIQNSFNLPGDINSQVAVDPAFSIGRVLSIDVDNLKAVVKLKKEFIDNNDISDMGLHFAYMGKVKDGGIMYDLTMLYSVFKIKTKLYD